jgi:nitrite reductase/ring-hydroxylating ferredoxin subunit
MHGAVFQIEDGHCIRGPCHGDRLERVREEIRDGAIWVPADAGL